MAAARRLLAASSSKLANYDVARTDIVNALHARPSYDVRCNALDTIELATKRALHGDVVYFSASTRNGPHPRGQGPSGTVSQPNWPKRTPAVNADH